MSCSLLLLLVVCMISTTSKIYISWSIKWRKSLKRGELYGSSTGSLRFTFILTSHQRDSRSEEGRRNTHKIVGEMESEREREKWIHRVRTTDKIFVGMNCSGGDLTWLLFLVLPGKAGRAKRCCERERERNGTATKRGYALRIFWNMKF